MSQKKEVDVLAETFESTRLLTKWYLSKLKGTDMRKVFSVDGNELNSAYWILGHLVWSENFLILQLLGGEPVNIPWLKPFGFGGHLPSDDEAPDIEEMFAQWKVVHEKAMKHLRSFDDEKLSEPNVMGVAFGEDDSNRMMIHHCIRHEAIHSGHLGWLCKMQGIKTV